MLYNYYTYSYSQWPKFRAQ